MKMTVARTGPTASQPKQQPDLSQKPIFPKKMTSRKPKLSGAGVKFKRDSGGQSARRGSRPETPLLKWKFAEVKDNEDSVEEEKSSVEGCRKISSKVKALVSVRKLGADLWRMHSPEFQSIGGQRLGLQDGEGQVGTVHDNHVDRLHISPARDMIHSPHTISGPINGHLHKYEPSFMFTSSGMEGATKWDPVGRKQPDETFVQPKLLSKKSITAAAPVISALETELNQARSRINELETERRSSKKKLEQFLQKLSEERAAWRRKEHEKIRVVIEDLQIDLKREKKKSHRLEIINSKLVDDLSNTKLTAKRYAQEYEKERKARELIEDVCDELAKEIGEDRTEAEALRRESIKFGEEVEEERKMLQLAEVWREERVQMKLVDAKLMLEDKYAQMNMLIADLESFMSKSLDMDDVKKAEFLKQVASSVNIQDVRELVYEPPNSDDISSIFEDVNFGGSQNREVEQQSFPEFSPVSNASKTIKKDSTHQNVYMDRSGELEDDTSEWETASHPEDQGSSYSPEGSEGNYRFLRAEWERNGGDEIVRDIGEVGSVQGRKSKKGSSISRLWKSNNNDNCKIISVEGMNRKYPNGRLSNGALMSLDHGSGKDGDMGGDWSSPDSVNPHITRGMKGCIEWPRNVPKDSLKSRLLEARMESQKVQLRQVLKHKC